MSKARVTVVVRGGDITKALKVFKKKCEQSNHLQELRERRYYIKPTTKRRLQKQQAVRLNQIMVEKEKLQSKY